MRWLGFGYILKELSKLLFDQLDVDVKEGCKGWFQSYHLEHLERWSYHQLR